MKKIVTLLFLIFSLLSFAKINDSLNLFNEQDKNLINEKIKEIFDKKTIETHVNTMSIGEGFQVKEPEKTVILNIKTEKDNDKVQVELSFSKDIDVEDMKEDLEKILDGAKELLEKKDYRKYVLTVLDAVDVTIQDIEISNETAYTLTQDENNAEYEKTKIYQFLYALIAFFSIVAIYEIYKKKFKNKEEKEDNNSNININE